MMMVGRLGVLRRRGLREEEVEEGFELWKEDEVGWVRVLDIGMEVGMEDAVSIERGVFEEVVWKGLVEPDDGAAVLVVVSV
jgi:hypothetical protein